MRYYVILVWRDVEPETFGPYGKESDREAIAVKLRKEDPCLENGIFWADIDADGFLTTGSYSAAWSDEVLKDMEKD